MLKFNKKKPLFGNGSDLSELGETSQITSEKLETAVKALEEKLQEKPKDKPLKKAIRQLRKDFLPLYSQPDCNSGWDSARESFLTGTANTICPCIRDCSRHRGMTLSVWS